MTDDLLRRLMEVIASGDEAAVAKILGEHPGLAKAGAKGAATRAAAAENFLAEIHHYVYAGDTALHMAGAAYLPATVRRLVELGADVHAVNRRGATPLHYAADGNPAVPRFNPEAQVETIAELIRAGADANAADRSGVTPLHRAIRNRCAAAANALLEGGADPRRTNGSGSTPMKLATLTTGRGGSGSPEAKSEQARIISLLERHGATA